MLKVNVGSREEEGELFEGWSSSCLAKFRRCLGMLMEGFEREILHLLRRMKERIDQKGHAGPNRRANSLSFRFERELKKLEWIVNYKGFSTSSGLGKSGGAFVSGCR